MRAWAYATKLVHRLNVMLCCVEQVAEDTYRSLARDARVRLEQLAKHGEKEVGLFHEAVYRIERSRPFFVPALPPSDLGRVRVLLSIGLVLAEILVSSPRKMYFFII